MKIARIIVGPDAIRPEARLFIDMEGVSLGDDVSDEQLTFRITTYNKLAYIQKDQHYGYMFNPVNSLLATLSVDEQKTIGMMFAKAHDLIDSMDTIGDLTKTTEKISRVVYNAFKDTGLSEKIREYVRGSKIPIPALEGIGDQPHHTDEKTFYHNDYIQLTAIVFVCKLLCPIFGELIFVTKGDLDNNLKEIHCIPIMRDLLGNDFEYISNKLSRYLTMNCEQWVKRSNNQNNMSLTNAFSGFTTDQFGLYVYASILVKKFVNVDLYGTSGDIVVYIFSCAKNTVGNHMLNIKNKNRVLPRILPNDNTVVVDGNDSNMEAESVVSSATADVPILTIFAVEHAIKDMLGEYELDIQAYESAVKFYHNNIVPATDLNTYILCTFVGHRIAGAMGIELLPADIYSKLLAVTQLYMLKLNMVDVAHAMTMMSTNTLKTEYSKIDTTIEMSMGASFSYKNLKRMFPYKIGHMAWDTKAEKICSDIITKVHTYNTAPVMWDMIGQENINNSVWQYDERILKDIFEFINHVLNAQEECNI